MELPFGPKSKWIAPPICSSILVLVNQAVLPDPVAIACHTCSGVPFTINSISTQRFPVSSFLRGMGILSGPSVAGRGIGRHDEPVRSPARRTLVVIACRQRRDDIGEIGGEG